MDNMQNLNSYLNEKAMQEALRGGPAYYRKAHLHSDPNAQYKAELKAEGAERRHRVLSVKVAGMWRVNLRLPRWVPVGRLNP
jgi:hypothetical protein